MSTARPAELPPFPGSPTAVGRPMLAVLSAAYALFVGTLLTAAFLLGGWAIPAIAGCASFVFVILNPLRAAFAYFSLVPYLLGFTEVGTLTSLSLSLLAPAVLLASWFKEWIEKRGGVGVPLTALAPYCAMLFFTVVSFAFGDWRRQFPEASPIATSALWQSCLATLPAVLLVPGLRERRHLRALAWVFVVAAIIPVASVLLLDTSSPEMIEDKRYFGLFANGAHDAALFELSYLVVALALLVIETKRLRRAFLVGFGGACVFAMILAGSRTTYVALGTSAALAAFAAPREFWRRVRVPAAYLLVLLFVVGLAVASLRVKLSPTVVGPTVASRAELARIGIDLAFRNPWTGVGVGVHQFYLQDVVVLWGFWVSPMIHTYYVTILAETGFLGFLSFMLIVAGASVRYVRSLRRFYARNDLEMYALTCGFAFAFVAVLMMFLTQAGIGNRLFWILVGVALGIERVSEAPARGDGAREPGESRSPPRRVPER